MRPGTQVAGSAIDRVFNPPTAPARRFRGALDAALTLAVGSVCAFGLTLGPAPLNTLALASAAAPVVSAPGGGAHASPFLLAEVDDDSSGENASDEQSTPPPVAADEEGGHRQSEQPQPVPSAVETGKTGKAAKPAPAPQPEAPVAPTVPEVVASAPPPPAAVGPLAVVEAVRTASGLERFVAAGSCTEPTVFAHVHVTPSGQLPPGLAKKTLAPDPAYATVGEAQGVTPVTIYACD